jgi:hypothetical protein
MYPLELSDYAQLVESSLYDDGPLKRRPDLENFAQLIRGEWLELMVDHGTGMLLLKPGFNRSWTTDKSPDIIAEMSLELGDLLWYSFSLCHFLGLKPEQICADALATHNSCFSTDAIDCFEQLENAVVNAADRITVPTKSSLEFESDPEQHCLVSLNDSPGYLLQRHCGRLVRALDSDGNFMAPRSAAYLEAPVDLPQALGDFINTLCYISKICLDVSAEDIALMNIQKLLERQRWGKIAIMQANS